MRTYDMETTITLGEEEVDVFIEFEVSSWGSPGTGPSWSHPGDPPEPAEFDVTKIVRLDSGEDITSAVDDDKVLDLVAEKVYEISDDRSSYDPY